MGQIKNIKLHIVTDIKTTGKMLSRLRAVYQPVASVSLQKLSTSAPVSATEPVPKFPYDNNYYTSTAWGPLQSYKNIAGLSAPPVLFLTNIVPALGPGHESYHEAVCWEQMANVGVFTFVLYHIYRLAQNPMKNFIAGIQKKQLAGFYAEDKKKLVDSEAKLAEAAVVSRFLEDRPEFFELMENQVELEAEVTYRKRLIEVESEMKKRLDYQVEMQNVQRTIEEKHIAAWVEKEVLKSIAEQSEEDPFQACINNLEEMAAAKAVA